MKVFEKNMVVRTVFLGVLTGALLLLLFQVSQAVLSIQQDVHGIAGESVALIGRAEGFIPAKQIDVDKINGVVTNAQTLLKSTNRTVHLVNAPCVPGPCGLLADGAKTLNTARGTMGQVEIAANSFDQHSSTFYEQEDGIAKSLNTTVADVDALVTDPDIKATLHYIADSSKDLNAGVKQGVGTITDIHAEIHHYVYPDKKRGFVAGFEATGDVFKHWIPSLF